MRFSVIIATYNRREYVLEAIRSVQSQTYAAHEIIVCIDGSQDGTADAVRQIYPSVRIHEQVNRGRSVAANSGVALATGDWICFLDDDDLWHEEKLQATADYIQAHPECQAARHPIWFFAETHDGPQSGFGFLRDFVAADVEQCHNAVAYGDISTNDFAFLDIYGDSFGLMMERNRGSYSATVVQREVLIRAGCLCPMQAYGDDWTMFVNIARLCEWHTIPKKLGFTRLHGNQITGNSYNGLNALTSQINAWYSGRPFPHQVRSEDIVPALARCGLTYRFHAQAYHWGALKSGNLRLAYLIRQAGKILLPRKRDYLFMLLPPPVTWRWEKYLTKKKR